MINSDDEKHGGDIVTQTTHGQWPEIIGDALHAKRAPDGCENASLKMELTR